MSEINYEILEDITYDYDLIDVQNKELLKAIRKFRPLITEAKNNSIICSCGSIAFDFNTSPTWMKYGYC